MLINNIQNKNIHGLSLKGKKEIKETKPLTSNYPSYSLPSKYYPTIIPFKAVSKNFQGSKLFDKDGYIDWKNKIGWDFLKQDTPLDWSKAEKAEIKAFLRALFLAEVKEDHRVQIYTPDNTILPLATYHTLANSESQNEFEDRLDELKAIEEGKDPEYKKPSYLDLSIIKPKTNELNLNNAVIFDTETTGINTNPEEGPIDKIIQIGAIKLGPDGKVNTKTALSQLINPKMDISEGASKANHITKDMLKDKPVIDEILPDFVNNYIADNPVVIYNSKFDVPMLNNAIIASKDHEKLAKIKLCLAIDPFIILQRIHPYLGASKKLGDQYKFLFGRTLKGAHDALTDVKGTADVFKYCCLYLNKNFTPTKEKKSLTVKDLLTFQFGGKVDGLNIELDNKGCDGSKSFKKSYNQTKLRLKNFDLGYGTSALFNEDQKDKQKLLEKQIGPDNLEILNKIDKRDDLFKKDEPYEKDHFIKVLKTFDFKPYNGKSIEEITSNIADLCKVTSGNIEIKKWMKNIADEEGNDLPDIEIIEKCCSGKM